jgi:hypothetical protein
MFCFGVDSELRFQFKKPTFVIMVSDDKPVFPSSSLQYPFHKPSGMPYRVDSLPGDIPEQVRRKTVYP